MYNRHLKFASVMNFRDIGGYKGHQGKTVAWRRVFRSGEFRNITPEDMKRLTEELRIKHVIDLRSSFELQNHGKGLLEGSNIKYCNIAFMTNQGDPESNSKQFNELTNLGDFYIDLARQKSYGQKIVEALELIADTQNHPLVFHCAVGKDRTGMLAAMILSLLGVMEADIIQDYTLSEPYMDELLAKIKVNAKLGEGVPDIPDVFWRASAESMKILLGMMHKEYGGPEGYLKAMGMTADVPKKLQKGLLV
jgi:protein-tyrosine phosphatase